MVVVSAVPRVVHFCTSLGTPRRWSLCPLLGFPRSCTRLLWIVVLLLRPPGRAPAKAFSSVISTRSSAAVPAACLWLRASWSGALLDADMPKLIDRSACLVEPVVVESLCSSRACAVPAQSTSSAASGRCSRMSPPRGLVEGLLLPELLLLSCSRRSCHEEPSARVVTQFCAPCLLGD